MSATIFNTLRNPFNAWQRWRRSQGVYQPNPYPKRVLIISASVGGGHIAAGRALETACRLSGLEAQHIDLLSYTSRAVRRIYSDSYFELMEIAPDFVNWIGKRLDVPSESKSRLERSLTQLGRLLVRKLPKVIKQYQPDVILHTHFWSPALLRTIKNQPVPEGLIITDYGAHGFWLHPQIGRYFVASEDIAAHMIESGVEKQRIQITGIPIDKRFSMLESKAAARATLNLSPERDVALLMASGMKRKILKKVLEHLIQLDYPLNVQVICGRTQDNLSMVECVKKQRADNCQVELEGIGYTKEMPRYMAAADVIIGKPGGLTTSEALASGLAFAVVSPYPLQEEANATFLLENGLGFRIEPLTVLNNKLKTFLSDADKRLSMAEHIRQRAKPDAAEHIIHSISSMPIPKIERKSTNLEGLDAGF